MFKKAIFGALVLVLLGGGPLGCGKKPEPVGKQEKSGGGEKGEVAAPAPKAADKPTKVAVAAPKGPEAEYSADGKTLVKYKGAGTEFTVRDGVTAIGDGAFAGCETLETVKLPASLTTIGSRAFAECRNLNGVSLPSGVTTIGGGAFQDCNFKSLAIPASVTTVGEKAFAGCGIETVEPPSREAVIGRGAFNGCPCEAFVVERCPNYKR